VVGPSLLHSVTESRGAPSWVALPRRCHGARAAEGPTLSDRPCTATS